MNPLLKNGTTDKGIMVRFEDLTSALRMLFFIIFVSFMQAGAS
jgi:hypothetical protein